MNFEEIRPFIRHCVKMFANNPSPQTLKSYDNCIVYALSGNGTIIVDDVKYQMCKGSVLTWRANQKYHICTSKENTEYIFINFDYTCENSISNSFKIMPEPPSIFNTDRIVDRSFFDDYNDFNTTVYTKQARHLEELFFGIISEFKNPQKHMNMRLGAKMIIILSEISKSISEYSGFNTTVKNKEKVDEIIEYIHENYTKELTNNDIAKFFNFHPQHINKIIKRKTGYSLHKYVIMRRISKAVDLIETTKMPIAEISEKIGFQNICHFSRYFKEFMGTSPRSYRKRIGIKNI